MSTPTFDQALHPRGQAANAGQFRAKENTAPVGDLAAPASAFPTVNAIVILQEEGDRDNVYELDRVEINLGEVFDGVHVDDLPESVSDFDRTDSMFFHARAMDLVPDHGGPFDVLFEQAELDAYKAAREAKHKYHPVKTMPLRNKAERQAGVVNALTKVLPAGGLKAAMVWDEPTAARWATEAQKTVVQSMMADYVQWELIEPEDEKVFAGIRDAAIPRLDGGNAYRARTAIFSAYEHLARLAVTK